MKAMLCRHAAKFATMAIVAALYTLAAPPRELSAEGLAALARGIRFVPVELKPADNGRPFQYVRSVHPDLRRIDAWISSVGAGVALADIAGSGRPADICLVDPRNDSVTVMPAPGTGERFVPFVLAPPTNGYKAGTIAPMGCLPADFNEDGRMDILVYYWGRTPVVFLRIQSDQLTASAFVPVEIVEGHEIWNTNAALLADVDGDGHPDLIFGNYFPDGLGVLDPDATDRFDMQHSMSRAFNGGRNRLLLWRKSSLTAVQYRDASEAFTSEMANGWTLALAARDLNDDSRPELYIANDFGPDRLLLNESTPAHPKFRIVEGVRDFWTPRSKVLGQDSFKGMGVDFGDVKGDGRPAIAVSNISSPYALLESHFLYVFNGDSNAWSRGYAPYRDESFARGTWTSGWAWDIKFADLANTGRPALIQAIGFVRGDQNRWPELQELAMGNDELLRHPSSWPRFSVGDDLSGNDHDRIFMPDSRGRFHDVSHALELSGGTVSRGIATGDVCGDGQLSVAIARQWSPSLFLRNVSPSHGRAIVIDLRVPGAVAGTRAAIGAEARVRLADGSIATSVVDGGSGHAGRRAPEIHLGLGDVPRSPTFDVEIKWTDETGTHAGSIQMRPGRHQVLARAGHLAIIKSVAVGDSNGHCS